MEQNILEMNSITKTFPGVVALSDVNFRVKRGQIHALVGENGAGKSTLVNILSGVYKYGEYDGDIIMDDNTEPCKFRNIKDSEKNGIAIIHQELALVPELSVAENIFLGNECQKGGIMNWTMTRLKAAKALKLVGLDISVETKVRNLGVGMQQLLEIAKALSKDVRLLILDEPTAALNDEDSAYLLDLLIDLKNKGITCILISHKLNEVVKVAQEITVLRDGQTVGTIPIEEATENVIIKMMVGRDLIDRYPKRESAITDICFEITDWNVYDPVDQFRKIISGVSINTRNGEVVGLYGLMGAGRTELALSLFGKFYGVKISGSIKIDGNEVLIKTVKDAIRNGLAYATEDRKQAGLSLMHSIKDNISIVALDQVSRHSMINANEDIKVAESYREKLNIRTPGILQRVGNLSGGNQQKVMFSKWIFAGPEILILDEPTRGVDVGAKYEIYSIINDLVSEGKSVLMISSELPELLGMCDRIYIMNRGAIVGEIKSEDATQENIMQFIMESNKE
ncbi:MAG: ATP-binding cassette domain-containing protein [Oscillospiraceae bacterium]|jgi:putative multiple sugar transport system ATP-binding protein|nr:ATP-binding cassette domain-containing protein [Oscillospiraceae bacterium]